MPEPESPSMTLSEMRKLFQEIARDRKAHPAPTADKVKPPKPEPVESCQAKIDMGLFEVQQLAGGFHITFSDQLLDALGHDREEFLDLNRRVSHLRENGPDEIQPEWLDRLEAISQVRFGVHYEDLDNLTGALRDCLMHARDEGNLDEVVPQLQTVFLPHQGPKGKSVPVPMKERVQQFVAMFPSPS